jgi:hypothetical protein
MYRAMKELGEQAGSEIEIYDKDNYWHTYAGNKFFNIIFTEHSLKNDRHPKDLISIYYNSSSLYDESDPMSTANYDLWIGLNQDMPDNLEIWFEIEEKNGVFTANLKSDEPFKY